MQTVKGPKSRLKKFEVVKAMKMTLPVTNTIHHSTSGSQIVFWGTLTFHTWCYQLLIHNHDLCSVSTSLSCLEPLPHLSVASLITNPLSGPCLRLSAPFCHDSWFQSYAELWVAADRRAQKHSMERKLHRNCISSAGIFLLYVLQNSVEAGNYLCFSTWFGLWPKGL